MLDRLKEGTEPDKIPVRKELGLPGSLEFISESPGPDGDSEEDQTGGGGEGLRNMEEFLRI